MRDPLKDPLPGDVVEANGVQLHVHRRDPHEVYVGRHSADGRPLDMRRPTIWKWRHNCQTAGAKVIQRNEDCPPEFIAAFTGRSDPAELARIAEGRNA